MDLKQIGCKMLQNLEINLSYMDFVQLGHQCDLLKNVTLKTVSAASILKCVIYRKLRYVEKPAYNYTGY